MRITGTGTLPLNVAKAYGIKPAGGPSSAAAIAPALRTPSVDSFTPSSAVGRLVAGTVAQPVNFDAAMNASTASRSAATHALQMYTRAADKMEAAIAVQIGRAIDVQG